MKNAFSQNGKCKLMSWDETGLPDYYGDYDASDVRAMCDVKIKNKHDINMCFLTGVEAEITGHSFKCGFSLNPNDELEFSTNISKHYMQDLKVIPRVTMCKYTCSKF